LDKYRLPPPPPSHGLSYCPICPNGSKGGRQGRVKFDERVEGGGLVKIRG